MDGPAAQPITPVLGDGAPMPKADVRGSTRRGVWVILDQSLSSLTNFGLTILVLRAVSPEEFGAFTVVLTSYMLALYALRALAGDPQLVRHSHQSIPEQRDAARAAAGTAVLVALGASLILAAVSLLTGGVLGASLLSLAVVLPGLLLQDVLRYAFFTAGLVSRAFLNDLVWAIVQFSLLLWLLARDNPTVTGFILAWGAAATIAAVIGAVQAGVIPRPDRALAWLSENRDLGPRFAAESAIALAAWQLSVFSVGFVAGLAALGIFNAARVILGPFNVLTLGATAFAVPEGSALWRRTPERLLRAAAGLSAAFAFLAVACTGVALLVPDDLGVRIVGATWPVARDLLPFVGLWVAAEGAGQAPRIGLMVLDNPKALLRARALTAPSIVLLAAVGAVWADARGAAIGVAIAHCLGTAYWWRIFETTFRRSMVAKGAAGPPVEAVPTATDSTIAGTVLA